MKLGKKKGGACKPFGKMADKKDGKKEKGKFPFAKKKK
jgi:hypothetical protein